jgi:polyhydroxybutyrate depolymerase
MNNRFFRFALSISGLLLPFVNRTNGTLVSRGRKRSYLLYVPGAYNPATPTPLVISLHGFGEWPAHQMQISHWNDLARRYGFIVVYPCGTQIPLRWHTYPMPDSDIDLMDDVTFISDLIGKLETEYSVDPTRIYVNGLSNGGGMAFVLSCKLPDRIAAIGSVSGFYPFSWSELHPSRPVPTIVFHGTKDPIVPYLGRPAGSTAFSLPSIPEWVAALAGYNGCEDVPLDLPAIGAVSGIQFKNNIGNGDVIFYSIAGGGHSWPGGGALPKIIVGNINRDIDATEIMWDFFRQHSLPENR